MADYINVLNRAASLDTAPAFQPFTGVRLWYDDEHFYFAGDESGRVLEQDQPWATQSMANDILASISGFAYQPFEAGTALLDMEAELGDGVNVGGVYSLLATVNTTFGAMCASDLAAPSDEEVNHEYPYKPKQQRQMERSFRQVYSLIEKTDSAIRLMVVDEIEGIQSELTQTAAGLTSRVESVEGSYTSLSQTVNGLSASVLGLNGQYSSLKLTVDGLTVTDASGTTRIKGSSVETDTLHVKAANIDGTLTADQVKLTGSISWDDLDSGVQSDINNAGGISASYARTLITDTLVASPTIRGAEVIGGRFYDARKETYITMESSGGAGHLYADMYVYAGASPMFHVYMDNSLSDLYPEDTGGRTYVVINTKAGTLLTAERSYYGEWDSVIKPQGNWDFSDATVDGLTHTYVPVWG